MTLDETILHAEEVADRCDVTDGDWACAEAHRQLAEWLKELKQLREHKNEDIAKAFQFGMAFGFGEKHDEMDKVMEEVKKFITPQQKTGHWIEEVDDYGKVTGWHCDKCYEDSGFTTDCKWDFCPKCGVKMVEPQEREDKE